ncbi:hypothetical protein ACFX15_031642 [Malus domestica]
MERAAFAAGQKKERKKYKKIKGVVWRTGGGCLYSRVRTRGDKGEREKSVGGSWSGRRELPFGQLAQTQEGEKVRKESSCLGSWGEETWRYGGGAKKVRSVERHGKDAALGSTDRRESRGKLPFGSLSRGSPGNCQHEDCGGLPFGQRGRSGG